MEATGKTSTVDDTVDRLRSVAHEAVGKVANATVQAAEVLGQKSEQLKNVERQFLENCWGFIHKNSRLHWV